MKFKKEILEVMISLVLAIIIVCTSIPWYAIAKNPAETNNDKIETTGANETEEINNKAELTNNNKMESTNDNKVEENNKAKTDESTIVGDSIATATTSSSEELISAISEQNEEEINPQSTTTDEEFKIALRWGGTSNQTYSWNANKSENRVIKLTFYYQNEVTKRAYAPGELVVTIPGIGKLNREGTIKASDIAADVYGSKELKRDWSYKYNQATDTYTFYNNHQIEQGETFNGSFEMLWEFSSRNCINEYEQKLKATLTAGEQTIETQELGIEYTSKRDTFYINKTAKAITSADGLKKYVAQEKAVSDYAWVQYTFRYNVQETNARALKSRYFIDTLPVGCVIAKDTNVIKNEDGTVSCKIEESSVPENNVREYGVIVGYPEEYIGKTIDNTAYLYGTYKDETEDVQLAESTIQIKLERIQNQAVGIVPGKYMSPDYVYKEALVGDISFSASLYATATTNEADEGYTVAVTDDLLEIYTPANTESGKEATYHTLQDNEYKFTSVTIPGKNSFTNANGYTLSDGDFTIKIYALYKKDVTEDITTRGLANYTKVYEGKWENNSITQDLTKIANTEGDTETKDEGNNVLAIRAEVSGLTESVKSFYISTRGTINVSENVASSIYENPSYIINYDFTELKDKDGNTLIPNIEKENYSQERIYERDSRIYGKGLLRANDTIRIIEKIETPPTPGYYYAHSDIEKFSVDENVEYFVTKLHHSSTINNKDSKEINKVEIHGVTEKAELETLIETLTLTQSGLTFKNSLSSDTDMQEYLRERANITKEGKEISITFDFSDNPITSKNFTIGYNVDARLNYEEYYNSNNPSYQITTYAYLENSELQAQSTGSHNEKTMATHRDSESILLALSSHQQLIKMVKTMYSGEFVQENAVTPMNTEYTYRLKLRNGYNTLINTEFIDILEHAELTNVDGEHPYKESEWYGTFKNIDTTYLEGQGLKTKAYYANTLTPDQNSWTLMENYSDGIWSVEEGKETEVKAIKVEIEGEIVENSIVYVDINMQSPNDNTLVDKKAYNTYQINCNAIDLYTGMQSTYMKNMPSNATDVRLVEKEYNVIITKTDKTTGRKLMGVQFGIYDSEGNKIRTNITGILGNTMVKGLKEGTYTIKEEIVPIGYIKPEDITLIIKNGKYTLNGIEYEDIQYDDITFIDFTQKNIKDEIQFWSQNEDGTWQSNNSDKDNSTQKYNSTEVTMTSNEFEVVKEGTIEFEWSVSSESVSYDYVYYTITNTKTGEKIDGTSNKIGGTSYGIVYDTLKYNTISENLEPGKYTISFTYRKDSSAHSGLDRAFVKNVILKTKKIIEIKGEEQEATLENNTPTINFNIENQRAKGSITIHKIDEYLNSSKKEQPLSGAKFDLIDPTLEAENQVVATGTTDSNGNLVFEDLEWGKIYKIQEKESLKGYELAVENTYLSNLNKDKTITIQNIRKTGTVEFTKQDERDGTKLEGAKYGLYAKKAIYDKEGNMVYEPDELIKEGTTNEQGKIIFNELIWGDYYIQEIETVYGYELSETKHEFTISAQTMENTIEKTEKEKRSKANLQLVKIGEKGNFLPGVEFLLYNQNGKQIIKTNEETGEEEKYITNEQGQLNIEGIEWGNYYIQEIKTPEGYERSNIKFNFIVNRETFANGNKTVTVVTNEETNEETSVIRNNRKKGQVTLTKYACDAEGNETTNILQNAIYELYSADGTVIGEYKTNEEGKITVENLEWDSYYFLEKEAPEGYSISDKKIAFVINSQNAEFKQELEAYDKQESGEIKINKTIKADSIYNAHGNSTFIFKIIGKDENNEEKVTLYRTITFTEEDKKEIDEQGNITKTITISNIEPYKYEITEEENYRYELSKIIPVANAQIDENNGNIGIINLLEAEQNKGEITFGNTKTSNSLLTDTGLITNTAQNEYYLIGIGATPKQESYETGTNLTASDFKYKLYYSGGQEIEAELVDGITINGKTTYTEAIPGSYITNIEYEANGKTYETQTVTKWIMPSDYFKYEVLNSKDKTISITGINTKYTSPEVLYIPSEYNGYKVKGIARPNNDSQYNKLSNIGNVKSVEIAEGVEAIAEYAFWRYTKIETIILPTTLTSIGNTAFFGCSGLTSIELPSSVTSIGKSAFSGCSGLTSIELPSSVTSIGDFAFNGCSGLTSIELPNSVTSIGDSVFRDCRKLTSINIPSSVTSIGGSAFYDCRGLTSINIPSSVTSIGNSAFYNCRGLTSIDLSNTRITRIGNSTFEECRKLTDIKLPNTITYIGQSAYKYCEMLTSIDLSNTNIITIDGRYIDKGANQYGAFSFCSNLTEVKLPNTLTKIGDIAFGGCSKLTSINIPEGVTSIGDSVFYGCSGLTSINVVEDNENYSSIDGVLYNKDKTELIKYPAEKKDITEYVIPEGVRSIGDSAFWACNGLTSIEIPEGVTSIGNSVFSSCSGLTNIALPSSVTSIGGYAFQSCSSLTSIDLSKTQITSIGNSVFSGCSGLTNIVLPSSVTSIESGAFYVCSGLTNIALPSSVTSIGNSAFSGCSKLTSINIPEGVTSIGNYVFYDCRGLTSINVAEDNANYSSIDGVLYNKDKTELIKYPEKKGLTEYIIPEGVTSIRGSAFRNCSGLTNIALPSSVTSIGNSAFSVCSKLTSIELSSSVTSIGNSAFSGCSGLTTINYYGTPEQFSSISIGSYNDYFKKATINYITE